MNIKELEKHYHANHVLVVESLQAVANGVAV